jgi:tRNA-binding protein
MLHAGDKLPLKQRITFGKFQNVDMRAARVISAPLAGDTDKPSRVITVDAGHLGTFTSVAQLALIAEEDLVGRMVVICCNLSPRQIGTHTSDVLVMGVPHPDSPPDESQALPLFVDSRAVPGDPVY